jgi:hypothetical protein
MLRDPAGRAAGMVTLFLPMEGAALGKAGLRPYHIPADQQTRGPSTVKRSSTAVRTAIPIEQSA